MNSATVKDLKLAIKKKVNDMEQSSMGHRHISWWVTVFFSLYSIAITPFSKTRKKLVNHFAVFQKLLFIRIALKVNVTIFYLIAIVHLWKSWFCATQYYKNLCNCRKHVWANYCLSCHNNKLLDDNEALQNFGVRNNSQVCLLCSAFKLILYLFSANSFSLH